MQSTSTARSGSASAPAAPAWRELPPYPIAAIVSLLLLGAAHSVLAFGSPLTPGYVVYLACLSVGLGALSGLALQCAYALLSRAGAMLRVFVWGTIGLTAAAWLADSLGAFARLASRYDALARWILASCFGAAVFATLLLLAMQPSARSPQGWLIRASRPVRAVVALALAVAAALSIHADLTLYVGLYVEAHLALRVMAFLGITFALLLLSPELRLPRLGRRGYLTAAVLFAVPCVWLHEDQADTVQGFSTRVWPATVLRSARGLLDLDRDGFSYLLAGGDCDDLDAAVYPAAREIPENGIDDNCAFGDLQKKQVEQAPVPAPKTAPPMNVVLITIDSLRWDRVGVNDLRSGARGKDLTPALDEWAKGAVNFKRAYAPGAWTSIALGATMRGVYARRLRWTAYFETNFYRMVKRPFTDLAAGEKLAKMFPLAYHDPRPPLAEWLRRRGMTTVAVVDDGFSQMLSSQLGAGLGFQTYREINVEPTSGRELQRQRKLRSRRRTRDDATTATTAISQVRYATRGEPFFLWAHFFGPHAPSTTRRGVPEFGGGVKGEYDHEVRYMDMQLARLLDAIDQRPEPTAVFITADHGEAFFERYRSHGADLDEHVIRVPLLAHVPGWPAGEVEAPVTLLDLMPTILALTQTPAPPGLDGIDLAPLVYGAAPPNRLLLADTWQYGRDSRTYNDMIAAFDGRRKVVLTRRDHSFSVHDQRRPDAPPIRIEGLAVDRLTRRIMSYLEETGGMLALDGP